VAVIATLALAFLVAPTEPADAIAAGACVITGTIAFSPSVWSAARGVWEIESGVIRCRGPFRVPHPEQMNGDAGAFSGIGWYTTVASGQGHCLRELGTGTVDYWIRTEEQDVHVKEPHAFLLAGAGLFTTPTLRGTFQIPRYEGNCLSAPVTKGTFLAQVTVVRVPRSPEYIDPYPD
jgi:hypothetical protein